MGPADDVFKAISDETRRSIIVALSERPMAVHEVASLFEVSRPAVSKHLKVLLDAGLISSERSGKNNVYRLNRTGLEDVFTWLNQMWPDRLQELKRLAERKN